MTPLARLRRRRLLGLSPSRRVWVALGWFVLVDVLFVRQGHVTEGFLGWRGIGNLLLSLGLVYALFYTLQRTLLKAAWGKWFLTLLLSFVTYAQASYFDVYGSLIGSLGVRFLVTDPTLTWDLAKDNFFPTLCLGALVLCATGVAILALPSAGRHRRKRPLRLTMALGWVVGVIPLLTLNWFGVPEYQHYFSSGFNAIFESLYSVELTQETGGRREVPRQALDTPPQIVWVIGESLALSHMSAYSYVRPTTPFLKSLKDEGRGVFFEDAVTIGTVTRISVPYMLAGLQGPDKKGRFFQAPTVFDYVKSRGMETALISSQVLKWSNTDKFIVGNSVDFYKSGIDFDGNARIMKGADDGLTYREGVLPWLSRSHAPGWLLVFHMDGSHYPYSLHSPADKKIFLPEKFENDQNAYDNSVHYTDEILQGLVAQIQQSHPKAWIFFSSDHGQVVTETNVRYHMGYAPDVYKNPLFVIPPVGVSSEALAQLRLNATRPVSQADIFATVLDLLGATAVYPHQGMSLLKEIPPTRVRIVSGNMATHEAEPTALILLPDGRKKRVDFTHASVAHEVDGVSRPLSTLEPELKALLDERNSLPPAQSPSQ